MRRNIIMSILAGFFIAPLMASACAVAPFEREGTTVMPSGASQAIIFHQDGIENFILDPQLKGDAKDFGLAFAFPSKPEVTESSRTLFEELAEYTKPLPPPPRSESSFFGQVGAAPATAAPEVNVIEQKDVGDFTAVVLQATRASALGDWLKANGYRYSSNDEANVDYYVQKGGYYFVALKMKTADVPSYAQGNYQFTPISFLFKTDEPFFPSRLARDTHPVGPLRIYALSGYPLIVAGAALPFSTYIDSDEKMEGIESLRDLIHGPVWLTKLEVDIDPARIDHDLVLSVWKKADEVHVREGDVPMIIEPTLRDPGSGVMEQSTPADPLFSHVPSNRVQVIKRFDIETVIELVAVAVMALLHLYIGLTLFVIAGRFGVRHRWRAWIPFANTSLLVSLAEKRWWWFAFLIGVPVLAFSLLVYMTSYSVLYNLIPYAMYVVFEYISIMLPVLSLLFYYTLLEHTCTALAIRCGRPSWWGPTMILVPPVGLVMLGMMAWSKKIEQPN